MTVRSMCGRVSRTLGAVSLLSVTACSPAEPDAPAQETAPDFNGTPPQGFGAATMVEVAPGTYRVATDYDTGQPDLLVPAGAYPVRRVAADRVRIGYTVMIIEAPDGTFVNAPPPVSYTTEATIRVGGTEEKRVAVIAALDYCGLPFPDAADLYAWGDEPVMRSDDTGEWQFTQMC